MHTPGILYTPPRRGLGWGDPPRLGGPGVSGPSAGARGSAPEAKN